MENTKGSTFDNNELEETVPVPQQEKMVVLFAYTSRTRSKYRRASFQPTILNHMADHHTSHRLMNFYFIFLNF